MIPKIKSSPTFNISILCLLVFLLTNCDQSLNETKKFDLETANSEIELRLRAYEAALGNGNTTALGNLYTEDAEILHDGRPSTKGRKNIMKTFERMVQDSLTSSGFVTTGLWGNEDLLVEQGTGFFAHSTGKWKSDGNYLLVWKKVDGEWKIFRDTWFNDEN